MPFYVQATCNNSIGVHNVKYNIFMRDNLDLQGHSTILAFNREFGCSFHENDSS